MARVLIVGCGYVGAALGARLTEAGHHVVGWGRSGTPCDGFACVAADVTSPATMPALPSSLEYLIYMVGATETSDAAYADAYVHGVRHVLDVVHEQCPNLGRFVFVSSTGVYAQRHGEWVDEASPAESTRFTGKRLLEGEALVRASQVPYTVVRFAGIYGPGRTRLIDSVRAGTAVCPPHPSYLNLIHREDCAGLLHHVLLSRDAHELYLGVDDEPSDRAAVLRWVADQLGLPEPRVDDAPGRAAGNKRCRNVRLKESGYRLAYPTYRDGYRELL